MKLILLTDVKKVGQRGTLVNVADGYAQNVLIPKKLALPATVENIRQFEKKIERAKEKVSMDMTLAKKALADIDGKEIAIQARANEKGTLFESINSKHVAKKIEEELKVSVPESSITIVGGPIKTLGNHRVEVKVQSAFAKFSVIVGKVAS